MFHPLFEFSPPFFHFCLDIFHWMCFRILKNLLLIFLRKFFGDIPALEPFIRKHAHQHKTSIGVHEQYSLSTSTTASRLVLCSQQRQAY